MPTTLNTFNAAAATRVPGVSSIVNSAGRDGAVAAAVATWSKHRPQVLVAAISGDGTFDYSLPADFDIETSYVRLLEYPSGERRPTYVDADDWLLYRDNSSTVLRFLEATPAVGETILLTYTTLHVVDGSGSTIDANDEDALADLAASIVAEWVSSYYSQATDSALAIDSRDYKSQATEYALRAKRFRALAYEHLGIATAQGKGEASAGASVAAASGIKDFDSVRLDRSVRLTHPQR